MDNVGKDLAASGFCLPSGRRQWAVDDVAHSLSFVLLASWLLSGAVHFIVPRSLDGSTCQITFQRLEPLLLLLLLPVRSACLQNSPQSSTTAVIEKTSNQ